jgi:methionyl-tRNA formyltransferase
MWTSIEDLAVQLFDPLASDYGAIAEPGTARLLRKQGKMVVACAGGSWVEVARVKSQGKREVGVSDWWNGLPKALREAKEIRFQ